MQIERAERREKCWVKKREVLGAQEEVLCSVLSHAVIPALAISLAAQGSDTFGSAAAPSHMFSCKSKDTTRLRGSHRCEGHIETVPPALRSKKVLARSVDLTCSAPRPPLPACFLSIPNPLDQRVQQSGGSRRRKGVTTIICREQLANYNVLFKPF